jgi:hypothetical protein
MDELDRIAFDVAISILQAEAEAPGSQLPSSVTLAEQIVAHLQEMNPADAKAEPASNLM